VDSDDQFSFDELVEEQGDAESPATELDDLDKAPQDPDV
jgi:hypothetical protein